MCSLGTMGEGIRYIPGYKEKEFVWEKELDELRVSDSAKASLKSDCLFYKKELARFLDYVVGDVLEDMIDDMAEVRDYFTSMFAELSEGLRARHKSFAFDDFFGKMFAKDSIAMDDYLEKLEEVEHQDRQVSQLVNQTNLELAEMEREVKLGKIGEIKIESAYKAALKEVEENEVYSRKEREVYARKRVSRTICVCISELLKRKKFKKAVEVLEENGGYLVAGLKKGIAKEIRDAGKVEEGVKRIRGFKPDKAEEYFLSLSLELQKRVAEELRRLEGGVAVGEEEDIDAKGEGNINDSEIVKEYPDYVVAE